VLEPSAELRKVVARIQATAQAQGLQFLGAGWSVASNMEDAEGGIESSIRVISARALLEGNMQDEVRRA
jgi:hypothetical protein